MDRRKLIEAFQDTVTFSTSKALRKNTAQAVASSKVYFEHFQSHNHPYNHTAQITVEENTSFAAAKKYFSYGKTAVLNFANPVNPGGGVQNGAMAQEECLCRSSNLYACLTTSSLSDYYQYHQTLQNSFYSDRLIYTKEITVFKTDDEIPVLMPEQDWFQVDVITCAAPYIAERKYTNRTALKCLFKSRIKNIFEVAIENGITTLILGAFGCGAFKNPPEVVASAFHEVITENQYEEQFDQIVFAIKSTVGNDPFTPCPNIMAFEQEFCVLSAEANKLRFSDNWALSQALGSMTLSSGRVLKGGDQFNPYLKWKENNPYFGKQFSILGDSISTLEGYNPKGYNLFYTGDTCNRTGVHEMRDTWWGKVIDYFGGELLVNNSWSGSRASKLPNQTALFPSGCSDERTGELHIGEVMPDVILIYLGTNDWAYGVRADDGGIQREYYQDEKTGLMYERYPCEDVSIFSVAYELMLHKIKRNYPNAEVFCCTLNETYMSSNPSFSFPHSYAGTHIERFNEVIRKKVELSGYKLIELYNNHVPYDAVDGTHPTATGMNTLATLVLRGMCDSKGTAFLDCEGEHDFITAEEYTGGSRKVCRKCGLEQHCSLLPFENEKTDPMTAICSKRRNRMDITRFVISDGDFPIPHYEYHKGELKGYNRINGSRDGGMHFPDGFFDDVVVKLNAAQDAQIDELLRQISFDEWKTDPDIYEKFDCPGFCVRSSFSCTFADGSECQYYSNDRNPEVFEKMIQLLQDICPLPICFVGFGEPHPIPEPDPDIVDLDPNCTQLLYTENEGIFLFDVAKSEDLTIKKREFVAGRHSEADLHLTDSYIARIQAKFILHDSCWLIQDAHSTNGTWLNETKLDPNKKYVLHPDDVIDFAHREKFVFFKTHMPHKNGQANPEEKTISILEGALKAFHDTGSKDEMIFKLIVSALINAPMYLPVAMDLSAMFGNLDPTKLKPGDVIQPQQDVRSKILTLTVKDKEFVPLFTSSEEMNKGPSASSMRMHPQDYLPKLIAMGHDAVVNPFGDNAFIIEQKMMKELLFPIVLQRTTEDKKAEDTQQKIGEWKGKTIQDRYLIKHLLGRGGTSEAYIAEDTAQGNRFVTVIIHRKDGGNGLMRTSVMQEAHLMMQFDHPAIPKVFDLVEEDQHLIVIREYIDGETLSRKLEADGVFNEQSALDIGRRLAAVLNYIHTFNPPYIYRDMKPTNVMLTKSGEIKLIDFGIAMPYRPGADNDSDYMGTKGYAAPEQYGGQGAIDPRADIFGLGMTLYHMLTGIAPGEPPYETPPIRQANPAVSVGMEYIVNKCIAVRREDRYPNCTELMKDLNDVQHLPPKKGFFGGLFGKKEKKTADIQKQWNPTVVRLYNGMDANGREKIFYGGIPEAQQIILSLANDVFRSATDDKLELCLQIYVQCWIRSRGGFGMQFRTPTYIKQTLVQRFSGVPAQDVVTCVERSLDIIYRHEPQLRESALSAELFMANVAEQAKQNVEIQELYLHDEEYGKKPDKPIFVNGFGSDKEYLSHLYTQDGVKLTFERVGSSEVEGICGPVDLYKLLLPDGGLYMNIFLCNYGTRNTTDVPKGVVYQ